MHATIREMIDKAGVGKLYEGRMVKPSQLEVLVSTHLHEAMGKPDDVDGVKVRVNPSYEWNDWTLEFSPGT